MSRIVLTEEFRELCDRLRCQPASEGLQGWPVQQLQWLQAQRAQRALHLAQAAAQPADELAAIWARKQQAHLAALDKLTAVQTAISLAQWR